MAKQWHGGHEASQEPSRTAWIFHGMRLDGLGELFPSQDSVLWNEPVLHANTTPQAELRWDELSWDAGRMEQIPSSLLQPSPGLTSNPHGQADGIFKINLFFGLGRHIFKSLQSHLLVSVPLASPGSPASSSMENTKAAALPDP